MSKKVLTYSDYLNLESILNSQNCRSNHEGIPVHDEMLFIIIHQSYELWFKQILHELDSILYLFNKDIIEESTVSIVVQRLNRIIEIQKVLIDQIRILETMTAMDFLEFRDALFPSSGFQSAQFRLLENKFGLRKHDRIGYGGNSYKNAIIGSEIEQVEKSEHEPSLFQLIEIWLERTPFLSFEGFNFWEKYSKAVQSMLYKEEKVIRQNPNHSSSDIKYHLSEHQKVVEQFEAIIDKNKHNALIEKNQKRLSHKSTQAALLIFLYRDEPILHSPYKLLLKLIEVDELFTSWRQRHATMVRRMIGGKIGTGGSSGHVYLNAAANKHKVFSELADLSTFFINRSSVPNLPKKIKQNLGYHFKL